MKYIINTSRDPHSSAGLTPSIYTGGFIRAEDTYHFIYNGTNCYESDFSLSATPSNETQSATKYIPLNTASKFNVLFSQFRRPFGIALFNTSAEYAEYAYGVQIESSVAPESVITTILVPENVQGATFANRLLIWLRQYESVRLTRYLSYNKYSIIQDLYGDSTPDNLPVNPGYSSSEDFSTKETLGTQIAPIIKEGGRLLVAYVEGDYSGIAKMLWVLFREKVEVDSILIYAKEYSEKLNNIFRNLNHRFSEYGVQFSWLYEDSEYTDPFGFTLESSLSFMLKSEVKNFSMIKLKKDGESFYVEDSIEEGPDIWEQFNSVTTSVSQKGLVPLPIIDYFPPFWLGLRYREYEVLYAKMPTSGSIYFGNAQLTNEVLEEMASYGDLAVPEGSFYTSQVYQVNTPWTSIGSREGSLGAHPIIWVRGSSVIKPSEVTINQEYPEVYHNRSVAALFGDMQEEGE